MFLRYLLMMCGLLSVSGWAAVEVWVEESEGLAWIHYQHGEEEVVRAFALDVLVDRGQIVEVSDFFVGPSTIMAQGYGIFPAAFQEEIVLGPGTNINWNAAGYTPVAVAANNPGNTLPGLGSSGVTLEFGAVWDPEAPASLPGASGTLCALKISQGAQVTVAPNPGRGGVLAADPDQIIAAEFTGAHVQPPEILSISVSNLVVTIDFAGGELEIGPTASGPWVSTGDVWGHRVELFSVGTRRFYRVRSQ